jgi:SH3-like domain-containing protein
MRALSLRLAVLGAVLAVVLVPAGGLRAAAEEAAEPVRGAVTNLPLPRYVSLKASSGNARRGPNLSYRVDWEFLRRGMPLRVTAEYGQWRRVEDAEGQGGWMHHGLLSGARTVMVQGAEMAPMLTEPSDRGRLIAWAEPGAVARLDLCEGEWCRISAESPEACEGLWCRISTGRVDGWVPRGVLWGVD